MNTHIDHEMARLFYEAVLSLGDPDECESFFGDLCTTGELRAIAQRFYVAKLLSEGKIYTDIAAETGASTATISRVNRVVTAPLPPRGGCREIIKRLEDMNG
ncbi:MAG: TrpR-like protein YerC/YecD [Oscillospiraceae bacterium]|jgi:TrpR-related protein YerC/YecD|nr:TrpR-like protein YerC/YecD [Oscillospiraceae bacterium]